MAGNQIYTYLQQLIRIYKQASDSASQALAQKKSQSQPSAPQTPSPPPAAGGVLSAPASTVKDFSQLPAAP